MLLKYFYHHEAQVLFYFTLVHEMAIWYLLGLKFRYDIVLPVRRRDMESIEAGDYWIKPATPFTSLGTVYVVAIVVSN